MIPRIFSSNSNPVLKRHIVNKVVAIAPQHLFDVVTDVDSYKHFLPFCKSSQILRSSDCGTFFDASLKIGVSDLPPLNSIEEEYVSRVKHMRRQTSDGTPEWIVEAKSIKSNLFHGLSSSWRLSEGESSNTRTSLTDPVDKTIENIVGNGQSLTNVEFQVEMSVTDPLMAAALDQVLESVALQQVAAFEQRCRDIPFDAELHHV
jgi:coenzyme Q-binding protein COQ10